MYTTPNTHVPMIHLYLDVSKDLRFDYHLSRTSIESLMSLLWREKTYGSWHYLDVLSGENLLET